MSEVWREIPGWPYEVSNEGRVRRSVGGPGARSGHIRKPSDNGSGYLQIRLYDGPETLDVYVHRLVAEAFVGPCPEGCECNHADGNKRNNRPENLEWVSANENANHAYETGLMQRGEAHYNSRLSEQDVVEIRRIHPSLSQRQLAERFGVHKSTIKDILKRRTWKHV